MEYDIRKYKKVKTERTKAIMVHTYGLPSPAKEIEKYCNENEIILIEDAAEAHGQTEYGRKCGSFGKILHSVSMLISMLLLVREGSFN